MTGAEVGNVFHVRDDAVEVRRALADAIEANDVVITCGGVSVGEHDHIRAAAEALGVKEVFWRVSMRPGKPFYFGVSTEGKPVFGLPGNPVSALIVFLVFVKPALLKMMGADPASNEMSARLGAVIEKPAGRTEFVRGELTSWEGGLIAVPNEKRGSHMLTGLAVSDCLIHVPAESTCLEVGDEVVVTRLQWGTA
jgi:molybdopterin molybdotransferase